MSTVIKGGTVVTADTSFPADVLIEGETISAIGKNLSGDKVVDAVGCYIMPGGIDPHTHMEMPFMGTYSADDFSTGTKAGISGGTTMTVDFVLPGINESLIEALQTWHQKAGKAAADYSFHMAITWWDEPVWKEMEEVVKRGINTFKHFMAYKGALMVNDDEMYQSFLRCGELGAMPLVHAENGDVVARLQQKYMEIGTTGPEGHAFSRPPEVEGEAVNRAIMIADQAGVPLYVVHVSCEAAHEAIRRARSLGRRVFGEPLIQHLTLDESEYFNQDWDHAARRVMSPPFRNKVNQDSLWAGLASGSLQVVATDHCAFTSEQKRMGIGDFTKIPNGTGGLEDRMPVLWTRGVNTGRLTMNEFVAVTSSNIAKILNIYPRKGAIAVGADADIVVWDPEKKKRITAAKQMSVIDYNVFEGIEVTGLPRYTLSRGDIVFEDDKVTAEDGRGQYVERPPNPPIHEALSSWKALTTPQPVERSEKNMPAGV
ncbi:dihydropyrimidinase [Bauldia sp.]|uniref:dihydropyrimidinase n=1 Tax=Bauldia sp. TaxID=2575872 RepID=UPI003BA9CECA